jgi:hypothetical protein
MAQLPYLLFEQRPPMSTTAFRALCESMLSKGDFQLLSNLGIDPDPEKASDSGGISYSENIPKTNCKFINQWHDWERALRLSLAKQRAQKISFTTTTIDPPFFPVEAGQTATKALANDISPLDGEMIIDKARWNAIENFAGNDYFSRDNVFAYYLKLLLLERRQTFNVDKGFQEYKALYASIIERAHHSLGEVS